MPAAAVNRELRLESNTMAIHQRFNFFFCLSKYHTAAAIITSAQGLTYLLDIEFVSTYIRIHARTYALLLLTTEFKVVICSRAHVRTYITYIYIQRRI